MGLDALRAAVKAEGDARVAAILRAAELEANRLRHEASSQARQRRDDELRTLEAELRREANEQIASARAAARKRVLDARDEFIGRVFDAAREALSCEALSCEAEAAGAGGDLMTRAQQALEYLPPGSPIVFACSSTVASVLEAAFADREGVRIERDPDLPVGFRATGAHGAVVIDATPSSLLDMDRPRLAIEILRQFDSEQDERMGGK